jgi:homopolymeric O-antigen transport system permease protein
LAFVQLFGSRPVVGNLRSRLTLAVHLARREVLGRYRGSALGMLWSLLTPLFMLAVYTFVFGTIFKARWTPPDGSGASEHSTAEFAVILFAGLVIFQLFAEVINRAPGLVLANVNYVKKIVFPLEILPLVALGSALFHLFVSLMALLTFYPFVIGAPPVTALLLPFILAPFCVLILGLAWFLASLGVYVRDISQFLGNLVTAMMFLSPIFFPATALPEWLRPYLYLNPIALPIEEGRKVLIWGHAPDWAALGVYSIVAIMIAVLGFLWFQKTRKGFADVV